MMKARSLVQKILSRYYPHGSKLATGEFANIRPDYVMTHDNTAAVMKKYRNGGFSHIHNPKQLVFCVDHDIQNNSEENLRKYQDIENFAKDHGVPFYPPGTGIGHQVLCEKGYVKPGTLVVASDSHSNMYGGLGCLGTPITRTDALSVWTTGQMWFRVPPVVRVNLSGKLRKHVSGKDLILHLIRNYGEEVLNCAVEFDGEIYNLSIEERLTIANMTTEWGAICGVFPTDYVTINWFQTNLGMKVNEIKADLEASYEKELFCNMDSVSTTISGPDGFDNNLTFQEIERKIPIQKAYLLSCVNGRLSDFQQVATVMEGERVAPGVKFYIAAASEKIQKEATELGYWDILKKAGAVTLPPGCGPCIGLGEGTLQDGEVGISATNRNFKGRMGSRNAKCYLASPHTVALSAIAGHIVGPSEEIPSKKWILSQELRLQTWDGTPKDKTDLPNTSNQLVDGFPETIEGNMTVIPEPNLNTDLIYAGKYTYRELSLEEQARVVMENYDPKWSANCPDNAILFASKNFGTGSSREQAATALLARGIRVVIAESFNYTFLRNSLNNGLICIEAKFGNSLGLWKKRSARVSIDFRKSRILVDKREIPFAPINETAQKLIMGNRY